MRFRPDLQISARALGGAGQRLIDTPHLGATMKTLFSVLLLAITAFARSISHVLAEGRAIGCPCRGLCRNRTVRANFDLGAFSEYAAILGVNCERTCEHS